MLTANHIAIDLHCPPVTALRVANPIDEEIQIATCLKAALPKQNLDVDSLLNMRTDERAMQADRARCVITRTSALCYYQPMNKLLDCETSGSSLNKLAGSTLCVSLRALL
jgi:hypothetical protein